jgi:plasmid stabilization system protein ParE
LRIAQYGAATWGTRAADSFLASFEGPFGWIERHPDIGRPRQEFGPDVRSWSHRGYILYYEHTADVFEVRRILHASTDANLADDFS